MYISILSGDNWYPAIIGSKAVPAITAMQAGNVLGPISQFSCLNYGLDRVFCPKICLFKTDGWHFGTEFLATQKTSISENYRPFKL